MGLGHRILHLLYNLRYASPTYLAYINLSIFDNLFQEPLNRYCLIQRTADDAILVLRKSGNRTNHQIKQQK